MRKKSVHHPNYSPLLTDFYQLTMAYGYWKLNMHEQKAAFHLLFRKNPFRGNYALCCGLGSVVDFLNQFRFQADDLDYLATLRNEKKELFFPRDFLDYLSTLRFSCNVDAVPEGTVVFPNMPLLRIEGPLLQCQLLESALLNMINFQTLIATKASRVCAAAGSDTVIEFGMRRAQGPDGAISASRAAYIGGCKATSNTLAGKLFDIPVKGTHAHSWVTAFPDELSAFNAYASIMPHNITLLVDTYNTLAGVKNAITVGNKLREMGGELMAIRLDSGDMADLSIKARKLLDKAGFQNTGILASNSLDEYVINDLKNKGARISAWGVGTNLTTAYDHPALDGVYKLSALCNKAGEWEYKLKLSEQQVKTSNPGRHQVRRFFCNEQFIADVIYDLNLGIPDVPETVLFDSSLPNAQAAARPNIRLDDYDASIDLLQPIFRAGQLVAPLESIHKTRERALSETAAFIKAHQNNIYPVGLEKRLFELKQSLVEKLR
jgi:nicotinate phosphoribosyltransferase